MARKYFGGYVLNEIIGGGGYTRIYKAHSTLAKPLYGNIAAIKILRLKGNHWERTKLIKQFEREAAIAMSLSHPNLVKVHNFGKFQNYNAIIMEYINGRNVKEIIYEREKYTLNVLIKICFEAGNGLAHIHNHNVVHKDVKPDNILVSSDLKIVKITDFGIAKLPRKLWGKDIFPKGGTITKFATISYVAPEQVQGDAEFRSDVFSFGVAIDEILTAKLEMPDKNHEDYFARIDRRAQKKKTGKQAIISADLPIPDSLKNIIAKATSYNPESRYQTVAEMLNDLEEFL